MIDSLANNLNKRKILIINIVCELLNVYPSNYFQSLPIISHIFNDLTFISICCFQCEFDSSDFVCFTDWSMDGLYGEASLHARHLYTPNARRRRQRRLTNQNLIDNNQGDGKLKFTLLTNSN